LLLRRSFTDQIADNHQPGGDANARLEMSDRLMRATRQRTKLVILAAKRTEV